MTTLIANQIAKSRTYEQLLLRFPPRIIREKRVAKSAYEVVDQLMSLESPTKDQLEFLELVSTLIEDFESRDYPTPVPSTSSLLQHLIEAKGVSQAEVAKKTKVSPSTLSEVLTGRRKLSVANMKRLATYFCISPAVFLEARGWFRLPHTVPREFPMVWISAWTPRSLPALVNKMAS